MLLSSGRSTLSSAVVPDPAVSADSADQTSRSRFVILQGRRSKCRQAS